MERQPYAKHAGRQTRMAWQPAHGEESQRDKSIKKFEEALIDKIQRDGNFATATQIYLIKRLATGDSDSVRTSPFHAGVIAEHADNLDEVMGGKSGAD